MYKFWVSTSYIQVSFLYIFAAVPIVPAIMERCKWICKYVQYRHLSFYDSDECMT